jgi:hypothetical protein
MKRRKFIIGHSYNQARDYAYNQNYRFREFVIVSGITHVVGCTGKNMEFVLLDYYWENEFFKNEQPTYKMFLHEGAIEKRVQSY